MDSFNARTDPAELAAAFRLSGPDALDDTELLTFLLSFALRRDPAKTAAELLGAYGDLFGVLSASAPELLLRGIGEPATVLLRMALPVYVRAAETAFPSDTVFDTAGKLGEYLTRRFIGARTEQICLVLLNGENRILSVERLSDGVVNTVSVEPRKIVEAALFRNAAAVVFAHNHPAGRLVPSTEDEMTTALLADALSTVGIQLTEHFLIAGRRFLPIMLYSEKLDSPCPPSFYGQPMIDAVLALREENKKNNP